MCKIGHWTHQTFITLGIDHIVCRKGSHRVVNVLFYTRCDQCLVWSMSGVVNVWCDQCLVWSMSYFTHGVINVWCDQCLVWSMSYFTHGVINVWCDQCLVWSMSVWSMSYNPLSVGCPITCLAYKNPSLSQYQTTSGIFGLFEIQTLNNLWHFSISETQSQIWYCVINCVLKMKIDHDKIHIWLCT